MSDDDDPVDQPTLGQRALRTARDVSVTIVFGVLLLVALGWLRSPSLPDRAPDFTLRDLDGAPVSLASFAGRTVVLNFWATWCGACRLEAPGFASFARAHPDVVVLGIAADGPAELLRRESRELGIDYPVLQGDAAVFAAYGVSTYPTTVVVAPDGSVRWSHTGFMPRPSSRGPPASCGSSGWSRASSDAGP